MSAFLDLATAARAALLAAPALAAGHVAIGRELPMPTERMQQIDIALLASRGERPPAIGGRYQRWETAIALRLRARAAAGQDGSSAIDALLDAVFARMASQPAPPGADRWTLVPDVQWDTDEADRALCEAQLVLRVEHFTGPDSLAPAP